MEPDFALPKPTKEVKAHRMRTAVKRARKGIALDFFMVLFLFV
jgi:hypothetical protein